MNNYLRVLSFVFLIIFLAISCDSKTTYPKPENLISKDKMVKILSDIYPIISLSEKSFSHSKNKDSLFYAIFKKYNIDSLQFAKSNFYYSSIPSEYEKVLLEVKKKLSKYKEDFDKLDSLRNIENEKQSKEKAK